MPLRVLIVDDDANLRTMLRRSLAFAGFDFEEAADGPSALQMGFANEPDVVVLDVGMPGIDGFEVCRRLRERSSVPVLMLTARADVDDRVAGLMGGADDYLAKPFAIEELAARLHALARRAGADTGDVIAAGDIEVDVRGREARRAGHPLGLTALELELLELLVRRANQIVSQRALWEHGWGDDRTGQSNALTVALGGLRGKLGEPAAIETVRGLGYRLIAR